MCRFLLDPYVWKVIPFKDGAKSPVIRRIPPKSVGDEHEGAEMFCGKRFAVGGCPEKA
jgi:hypothetical protein